MNAAVLSRHGVSEPSCLPKCTNELSAFLVDIPFVVPGLLLCPGSKHSRERAMLVVEQRKGKARPIHSLPLDDGTLLPAQRAVCALAVFGGHALPLHLKLIAERFADFHRR